MALQPSATNEARSSILTMLAVIVLIVGVCGDVIMAAIHWLQQKD